jgi:hypothetical protein
MMEHQPRWVAPVLVATITTAIGIAQAAIPDASGVIHACYKSSGQIRVVNSAANCKANETALTWSQAGPQGVPGPAGATGPSGLSGYEVINNIQNGALQVGGNVDLVATCSPGKKVLGGGYVVPSVSDTAPLSRPEPSNTAWRVSFHSNGGSGAVSVYVICAFVN